MNIGNYELTSIEEKNILSIYETLKCAFPSIKIQYRKEIIGIGEEGRHLLCYFLLKDDAVFVKFKNQAPLILNNSAAIQKDIDVTVELFRKEEFNVKTKASVSNTKMHVPSEKHNSGYEYINDHRVETVIDIEDALLALEKNDEIYNRLFLDLIDHIYESAMNKLKPRECAILLSRFGINEHAKTLQEIGNDYSISRERVRQIILKAIRKLNYKKISTEEFLGLENKKVQIVSQISEVSAAGFLFFLFLQEANIWLIKFICKVYFHSEIDVLKFRKLLDKKLSQKKQEYAHLEKSRKHNDNIYRLIHFPNRRRFIADEDFSRLKTERLVCRDEEELIHFQFSEQLYQCESYLEQRMLRKFLVYDTFKSIKTQSLKIPFKGRFYHPDFQCLTHDNHLVLIEIKPLLMMGVRTNIEKFEALKEYCEKYGFGYLIIDERGNSFEDIDEENAAFSKSVLTEIYQQERVTYERYRQIYLQTNASIKNFVTLIKKHRLHFSFPFCLRN